MVMAEMQVGKWKQTRPRLGAGTPSLTLLCIGQSQSPDQTQNQEVQKHPLYP